ncbi:MAG: hypothetical protein IJ811_04560 [Clostridia bacterium]|nr:hypothetical protein [Clostridia bacterium]
MTLQEALDRAYYIFREDYSDEERLWNLTEFYRWSEQPPSEKQLNYIKSVLKERYDQLIKDRKLSKGDCSQIINMLKIKDTTPKQLARLRKKRREELDREQEDKKRRSLMKIRYELSKKREIYKKYYALILPDDLVITDSWETASRLIEANETEGVRIRYKGFTNLDGAIDFLRS